MEDKEERTQEEEKEKVQVLRDSLPAEKICDSLLPLVVDYEREMEFTPRFKTTDFIVSFGVHKDRLCVWTFDGTKGHAITEYAPDSSLAKEHKSFRLEGPAHYLPDVTAVYFSEGDLACVYSNGGGHLQLIYPRQPERNRRMVVPLETRPLQLVVRDGIVFAMLRVSIDHTPRIVVRGFRLDRDEQVLYCVLFSKGSHFSPLDLAVDLDRNRIYTLTGSGKLHVFDCDGKYVCQANTESNSRVTVDSVGLVYTFRSTEQEYEGPLPPPMHVYRGQDGSPVTKYPVPFKTDDLRFLGADSHNGKIWVCDGGRYSRAWTVWCLE